MIVDRRTVLIVERLVVRCNECPRQVSIYVGTGHLDDQLSQLGWLHNGEADYCEEHS